MQTDFGRLREMLSTTSSAPDPINLRNLLVRFSYCRKLSYDIFTVVIFPIAWKFLFFLKKMKLSAKFIDSKLRLANKEASDEEMDHLMDRVVAIFRFIQGKKSLEDE